MSSKKEQRASSRKLGRFLTELAALTEKYQIKIAGSGDLGSPWLFSVEQDVRKEKLLLEYLRYCPHHHVYGSELEHDDFCQERTQSIGD